MSVNQEKRKLIEMLENQPDIDSESAELVANVSSDITALTNNLLVGVVTYYFDTILDDFIIYHINDSAKKILKLEDESVVGALTNEAFPEYHKSGLLTILQKVHKSGISVSEHVSQYVRYQKKLFIEHNIVKLPSGLVVDVIEDIDEKCKTDSDLLDHASFVMNSPNPALKVDLEGKITLFNPSAQDIFPGNLHNTKINNVISELTQDVLENIKPGNPFQIESKFHNRFYLFRVINDLVSNSYFIYTTDITNLVETRNIQKVLFEITKTVHQTDNMIDLYRRLQVIVGRIMDTSNFFVVMYDREKDTLSLPYFVDEKDSFSNIPAGRTLSGYVIKTNTSMLLSEEEMDEMTKEGLIDQVGSPSKQWLGVPLKAEGIVIGAIIVQSYDNPEAYDESHKRILEFISDELGGSIQRKQSESALRESEELYRTLIEQTSDSIFVVQNEKVVLVNPAWEKLTGYSQEEVIRNELDFFNIVDDQFIDAVKKVYEFQSQKNSEHFDYETLIRNKSGKSINLEVHVTKISFKGKTAYQAICHDITERTRALEKINQYNEELKVLNVNKDKFFSLIAHDLKSPFNALLGYSDFIINEYEELTNEEIFEGNQHINKAAKNIYSLLENLLHWSGIQTGGIAYQPTNFLLYNLGKKVFELYQKNADNKGIELILKMDKFGEVYADENMIYTVLRNLVSNAIKFTSSGGEVVLSSQILENCLEVLVEDNGVGISEDDCERLFRTDLSHSTRGTNNERGTGLGLILCKELIDKNIGHLNVKSRLNEGTTFTFTLPLHNPE